jgi:hypothetical protein
MVALVFHLLFLGLLLLMVAVAVVVGHLAVRIPP